jgi:hypothetical protein
MYRCMRCSSRLLVDSAVCCTADALAATVVLVLRSPRFAAAATVQLERCSHEELRLQRLQRLLFCRRAHLSTSCSDAMPCAASAVNCYCIVQLAAIRTGSVPLIVRVTPKRYFWLLQIEADVKLLSAVSLLPLLATATAAAAAAAAATAATAAPSVEGACKGSPKERISKG